jgi:hypothetical protein
VKGAHLLRENGEIGKIFFRFFLIFLDRWIFLGFFRSFHTDDLPNHS